MPGFFYSIKMGMLMSKKKTFNLRTAIMVLLESGIAVLLITVILAEYQAYADVQSLKLSVYGNGSEDSSLDSQLSGIRTAMKDMQSDIHDIKGWLHP